MKMDTKTIIVLSFLFAFLSGCTSSAGEIGHRCLEGGICIEDHSVCSANNTCEYCGILGEQCCPGEIACQGSDLFCSDDQCLLCGGAEQPCCPGDSCRELEAFPHTFQQYCHLGTCETCGIPGNACCPGENPCGTDGFSFCDQGVCSYCGFEGQPCCSDDECSEMSTCNPEKTCERCLYSGQSCSADWQCCDYHACGPNQTCESCGGVDEAVCSRDGCRGWLVEQNGKCTSPFETNQEADPSICMTSHVDEVARRDLCFWHAAYFKNDPSLCRLIEFEEAKKLCEEGKNPKHYTIFSWPKIEWTNP